MDFDNPKVYGDTYITDGLVFSKISSTAEENRRNDKCVLVMSVDNNFSWNKTLFVKRISSEDLLIISFRGVFKEPLNYGDKSIFMCNNLLGWNKG